MVLITGCARSGTQYAAMLCQACGLDVRHERLGRDGAASWAWAVRPSDGERMPAYHDQRPQPAWDVVLHQVRAPLATIGSCLTLMRGSWDWICAHAPIEREAPALQRAAEYWLHWNRLAAARACLTYRVEDLGSAGTWAAWTGALGIEAPVEAMGLVPRGVNSRRHAAVSWAEVLAATPLGGEVAELARGWGYGTKDEG